MVKLNSHFEDIRSKILNELSKAKHSIFVASAFFTDYELADMLGEKAEEGLSVDLIISRSPTNNPSEQIFERLREKGVNVYKTGAADFTEGAVMHNKFCVIDFEKVITGSYNWTRQAERNEENVVVFNDKKEADKFLQKFYSLRKEGGLFSFFESHLEINLSVDRNVVDKGDKVKITWKVTNAEFVSINVLGAVESEGETDITILDDTTIVINAESESPQKSKVKTLLIKVVKIPIIKFDISTQFIIRSQKAELIWNVENAESIKIDPQIGLVDSKGSRTVNPFESTSYTLTAFGLTESSTRSMVVNLNVFPTPVLDRLQIPTPTNIRIEASFEKSNVVLPSVLNIGAIEKFSFNFPRMKELNTKLIPNKVTVKDVSLALGKSTSELYESIGESEKTLKGFLFNKLERIFRRNPKMTEIIKTVRKNYE